MFAFHLMAHVPRFIGIWLNPILLLFIVLVIVISVVLTIFFKVKMSNIRWNSRASILLLRVIAGPICYVILISIRAIAISDAWRFVWRKIFPMLLIFDSFGDLGILLIEMLELCNLLIDLCCQDANILFQCSDAQVFFGLITKVMQRNIFAKGLWLI